MVKLLEKEKKKKQSYLTYNLQLVDGIKTYFWEKENKSKEIKHFCYFLTIHLNLIHKQL